MYRVLCGAGAAAAQHAAPAADGHEAAQEDDSAQQDPGRDALVDVREPEEGAAEGEAGLAAMEALVVVVLPDLAVLADAHAGDVSVLAWKVGGGRREGEETKASR